MTRSIILHSASLDRRGGYRDAGSTLTVGADDDTETDLGETRAAELVNNDSAAWLPEASTRASKAKA
jgi:hypothetical protein